MNRITITAGIGEDRHGHRIAPEVREQSLAVIRGRLAATFGGYTELQATGGWTNAASELVTEDARRWVVLANVEPLALAQDHGRRIADMVRRELNQAAVVLEVEPVAAVEFVEAETIAA